LFICFLWKNEGYDDHDDNHFCWNSTGTEKRNRKEETWDNRLQRNHIGKFYTAKMGRLIKNHWARLIIMTAATCKFSKALSVGSNSH
jgi:hypothetical protein